MKTYFCICMEISYIGQLILQLPHVMCQPLLLGRSVNANGVCRIGRSAGSPEVGTEHLQYVTCVCGVRACVRVGVCTCGDCVCVCVSGVGVCWYVVMACE